MLDLLTNVKYLLKVEQVCIDNNIFRLHYQATAFLLAVCSIIITSKQYIGDPIDCILASSIDQEAINAYCWIFSTFTITTKHKESHWSRESEPYPGIGNEHKAGEIIHQKYYQWVCFILAIQAAFFLFPHCLWRVWEGGRIKMLVADLCTPMTDRWTEDRKRQTVDYLSHSDLNNLSLYAFQFLFCEFLNVANVVAQILVWDKVLGNRFLRFGIDVIQFAGSEDVGAYDPVSALFPKMTKCTFHYYALMTITGFLYDVVLFRQEKIRMYVLQAQARFVERGRIRAVVSKGSVGHWFLLHQLGRNMNPFVFGDLVSAMAGALGKNEVRMWEVEETARAV